MAIWNPRQIAAQNIDSQGGSHKDGSCPESPVTMHAPPIRPWIGLSDVTAISFMVVFASGHCVSISGEYSPLSVVLFKGAKRAKEPAYNSRYGRTRRAVRNQQRK
jgi:hypothetical protein